MPAICLALICASCAKEKSLETGGAGGNNGGGGGQITKIETTGVQNSVAEFQYDNNKRLISQISTTKTPLGSLVAGYTLTRDASGRVTRSIEDITGGSFGSQRFVTDFYYVGPSDTKVKYGMSHYELTGILVTDSVIFTYTNSKVSKTFHYISFDDGATYLGYAYYTYAYDSRGNIIENTSYSDIGSGFEPVQNLLYEYDNKVNPGNFKDDALIETSISSFFGPNNPTSRALAVPADPSSNYTINIAYQYRTDDKPEKSTASFMGASFSSTYTYQ